jgi:hypothetical protein
MLNYGLSLFYLKHINLVNGLTYISAETSYQENPSLEEQMEQATQQGIQWLVILKDKVYFQRYADLESVARS